MKKFANSRKSSIFATDLKRVLSSAGSEHLPYKQRVTGSNPVGPTFTKDYPKRVVFFIISIYWLYVSSSSYQERVLANLNLHYL